MTQSYEVIIVGTGPGGGMAANLLGQAGCRVLVLERQKLPRYKPCAGGMPSSLFASLPASCAQAIERRVSRVRFILGSEGEVSYDLRGDPIAMVRREQFDYLLVSQASATVHDGEGAEGLEIEPAGVVVHTNRGERYRADYVVGADGAFSLVARAAGLRPGRRLGPALEAEVPVSPALLERYADTSLFIFGAVRRGYVWAFPKSDHVSFGIGASAGSGSDLRRRLFQAAEQVGLPGHGLRLHGHGLPVYRHGDPLQRGHILLVGDAAGLLDPLSGEGVRHALASARLASEAILSGEVAGYSRRVYEGEVGRHLRAGLWLAWLFYGFPRLCYKVGVRNATVVSAMVRMVNGEVTYRQLLGRLPGYWLAKWRGRAR